MKYSTLGLEIIRTHGKKGLKEYHATYRKCSGTRANSYIESKKYKEKYKKIDSDY